MHDEMQPQNPEMNNLPSGEPDHEGAMARADLYKLANYSLKLFKQMEDNAQLEAWVQAKITKAADYIASVYHYLEYEMQFSEYGKKIENSDVYSESQKTELKNKLMEAREKVKSLKIAQADKISVQEGTIFGGGEQACPECGGSGVVMVPERSVPEAVKGKVEKYKRLTKAMHAASKRLDKNNNGIPDSMEGEHEVDEETSSTGGTITRPKPGVTRHTHNPDRFSDEPHGEVPSKAKSKSAAEKSGEKAADKQTEKDSKDWQKRFGKDSVTKVSAGKKEGGEKKTDESIVGQGIYEGDMKVGATKKTRTGILTKTKTGVVHKNTSYNDEEHGEPASKVKSKSAAEKKADKDKEVKLPKHTGNTWGMKNGEKFGKKMEEGKKPDFLDLDKDGDKKEPMKKAAKEKKVEEGAPSAGMSKGEKSSLVKKAKAGKDIGKPGKNFEKVAKAAEKGGAKDGAKVAAAAMWKNAKKKVAESLEHVSEAEMPSEDDAILAQLAQTNPTGLQAATAAGPDAVAKLIQDTKAQAAAATAQPTMGAAPTAPAAPTAQPDATAPAPAAQPVAETARMREQLARLNRYENLQVTESAEVAQLRKLTKLLG